MFDNSRIYFRNRDLMEKIVREKRNYTCTYDADSNIYKYPIKYKIGNLVLLIHEHYAYMENSLHKYYNKIFHGEPINFNDFSYCEIISALDNIASEFSDYDFHDTKISNLEFGFNLPVDTPAREIISKNIILHKYKSARVNEDEKGISLKRFKSGNYEFKIYDKALDCMLPYDLIRIEIIFKAKELKRLGILNVCDLYEPEKVKNLFSDFLNKFDQLIIIDDRFSHDLENSDIAELGNMLEPSYWKQQFGCSKTKTRLYQKLKQKIVRKNLNNMSNYLKDQLQSKFVEIFKDCQNESLIYD